MAVINGYLLSAPHGRFRKGPIKKQRLAPISLSRLINEPNYVLCRNIVFRPANDKIRISAPIRIRRFIPRIRKLVDFCNQIIRRLPALPIINAANSLICVNQRDTRQNYIASQFRSAIQPYIILHCIIYLRAVARDDARGSVLTRKIPHFLFRGSLALRKDYADIRTFDPVAFCNVRQRIYRPAA